LAAALSYYLLPDVRQKFKFITPGSVIGTLVWLLASWSFATYVSHFGSYDVTYGSIGGVIVLLTWFYITGFILLMGGEMNAIIEDASPDGKASGARAPDQVAPPPASARAPCPWAPRIPRASLSEPLAASCLIRSSRLRQATADSHGWLFQYDGDGTSSWSKGTILHTFPAASP
jgi:membrane protein